MVGFASIRLSGWTLLPFRSASGLRWWQIIERLGAVWRTLVWDGNGGVGRSRQCPTEFTQKGQVFARSLRR
jgi:hypothetical protein